MNAGLTERTEAATANRRVFLFLQGPASPFLRHVADRLERLGHDVLHVSFCLGDRIFWAPRPTIWFRGRADEWPQFVADLIERHGVDDLLMLGDGRPVHAEAIGPAFAHGCRVHVLEHGYIRPDWLTLEPDGMSGHSRFPADRERLDQLAAGAPLPNLEPVFPFSFLTYALYDLVYHLPNVALGWLAHPHYRRHGPVHPLVEYAGWIFKWLKSPWENHHRRQVFDRWLASPTPLFLFPLQLPGDYQIKRHAPGGDLFTLVDAVIAHFARHAPSDARLLFKIHPIDNGLSRWHQRIGEAAARSGARSRVAVVEGGSLDELLKRSAGVVTINSTVGTAALIAGTPLITLGNAVFDAPGLTHQGTLETFWTSPSPPDRASVERFLKALAATIQLRGGFIGRPAIVAGADAVAARLHETVDRLPLAWRRPRIETVFRYRQELDAV